MRMALRILAVQWLAIGIVAPAIIFGAAHVFHVPASTIWHDLIARPRNLIFVLLPVLFAGRTWFAYKFEGQGELDRRRQRTA